jgi:hypothetical protein
VVEIEKLSEFCKSNLSRFQSLEGSEHIATFSSQLNLASIIVDAKARNVLDFGTGIGTLVPLILQFSEAKIYAVEKNAWCQSKFKENMSDVSFSEKSRIELHSQIPFIDFDLVIIDDDISRREIHKLLRGKDLSFIFVEGWRNRTIGHISKRLPLFGFSAEFVRGKSRLSEFGLKDSLGRDMEKAGSWFLLSRKKPLENLLSWINRINETDEIKELLKEFYFWLRRKLSIRSRLGRLKP